MNIYPVDFGLDVSVKIVREGDIAFVDVLAPLYSRKEWRISWCSYNAARFSDAAILRDRDLLRALERAYGVER